MRPLRKINEAATLLEGGEYPTANNLIPFLITVDCELQDLELNNNCSFVKKLRLNLASGFPDFYKKKQPFSGLTLLDPRYLSENMNTNATGVT